MANNRIAYGLVNNKQFKKLINEDKLNERNG